MSMKILVAAMLVSAIAIPALAQSNTTTPAATTAPAAQGDMWRASKIKGLNVYNDKNEKLGDINEILIDKSGKVEGVVIGVGGFIGMGEHDIMVEMSKLKFVNEPVQTSTTTTKTAPTTTTPTTTTTTTNRSNEHKWYPDHAVLSDASKDQLKSMPQFKYD